MMNLLMAAVTGLGLAAGANVNTDSDYSTQQINNINEEDVYIMAEDNDYFCYLPLKAIELDSGAFLLTDTAGSDYISFENLKDGQNYIGKLAIYSDKLYKIEEGDFEFTYEDYFVEENLELEREHGEELLQNMFVNL